MVMLGTRIEVLRSSYMILSPAVNVKCETI